MLQHKDTECNTNTKSDLNIKHILRLVSYYK